MQRNCLIYLFFLIIAMSAAAGARAQSAAKFTISGYIKDTADGESLIAATVAVVELSKGTNTNNYGFYSLSLPAGKYTLKISYVGYTSRIIPINLTADLSLSVELNSSAMSLVFLYPSYTPKLSFPT